MDTDEYGISLAREIGVCRHMIRAAEKDLARLAARCSGAGSAGQGPGMRWQEKRNEAENVRRRWQERLEEYERVARMMRG